MLNTLISILIASVISTPPDVDVVYPRPSEQDSIAHIDSVGMNFIFGSVKPASSQLIIDGVPISHHSNGAFLTYLPVNWGTKQYEITAIHEDDTTQTSVIFDAKDRQIQLESPDHDFPVLLSLHGRVARTEPNGAYFVFPFNNTEWISDKWENGYYRLPLSDARSIWIADYYVYDAKSDFEWEPVVLWQVDVVDDGVWERIVIPVERKPLYRIYQGSSEKELVCEIYGIISHVDKIHYQNPEKYIDEIRWDQPVNGTLRLSIHLDHLLWGYHSEWDDNGHLILSIRKPPDLRDGLSSLKILIDPGHGGDNIGAIGPKRSLEKDINLQTSLILAEILRSKGADVVLSRSDDTYVPLSERMQLPIDKQVDLCLSIHHNALPDGTNPFGNFGTSTHYYFPHSRSLARTIQKSVYMELNLPDEGIYYHNLAMTRISAMPAVLLEAAYMMFPEQEAILMKQDYASLAAIAVYKGIDRFIDQQRRIR